RKARHLDVELWKNLNLCVLSGHRRSQAKHCERGKKEPEHQQVLFFSTFTLRFFFRRQAIRLHQFLYMWKQW
ncbi:MAG: hypothetical protein WC250_03360, partial [Candidatus Paceibacterota bacterium]